MNIPLFLVAVLAVTCVALFSKYQEERERASQAERARDEAAASLHREIAIKNQQLIELDALCVRKEILIEEEREVLSAQRKENERLVTYYRDMLEAELNKEQQTYPWLATHIADVLKVYDMEISKKLKHKKRPALKAAEEVASIAKEKRALQKENKMLQYQMAYYETLFPWLEEFKQLPPQEGYRYVITSTDAEQPEYELLRDWLSPEEYQRLPTTEKYQLALDRYNARKKTDWDAGIEYERYVGYVAETSGFKVRYIGARQGLEDMGRDLLLERDGRYFVVQCKRWAKQKTIHEKHIFQLFGTTTLLQISNPGKEYVGAFITTTTLSDTAKECAARLNIRVVENYKIRDWPMIKCHNTPDEKIYHLPMDQQYDRVQIGNKPGSMFVWTAKEAEDNGFRRAYRWNPHKE